MIIFKKIILEGFGSYIYETKFKLDRPGLNIVIGLNGAGKSHIPSAISWALFGKALKETKDVTTWEHLRPKDFKGTQVILKFNDYTLVRYKDYKGKGLDGAKGANRIILWDGTKNILTGSKTENQETLNELLGFNYEVLTNSIIFGQRMKRLIQSSGPEKKKVFEEAFNASFIKEAKVKAEADYTLKKQEYEAARVQCDKIAVELNAKRAHLTEIKNVITRLIDNRDKQLAELENELNKLRTTKIPGLVSEEHITHTEKLIAETESKIDSLKWVVLNTNNLNQKITHFKAQQQSIARTRKSLENEYKREHELMTHYSEDHATCETCGSKIKDITRAKLKKKASERVKELEQELYELESQWLDIGVKMEEAQKELSQVKIDDSKLTKLNKRLSELKATLKDHNKRNLDYNMNKEYIKSTLGRIKHLKETPIPEYPKGLKEEIQALEKEHESTVSVVENLKRGLEDLHWLVNDLLGNKGLKAYIFESMLKKLNALLVYYEQFIGFRVEFRVDLESGNKDIYTICYRGDHIIFYEDLSGGQKQLVDAVTTFAMYDLISKDKPTNLLFFDEPFESLSPDNIEIVYDLINDKASPGRSIYLITHQIDLQSASTKVIRMSLSKDGSTQLKTL